MPENKNNQPNEKNTGSNPGTSKSSVTGSSPIEPDHSSPDGNANNESPRKNDNSNDLRSGRSDNSNKDMGQP